MFHPNHFDDTLQFHMQLVVNDKGGKPGPQPSSSDI
jgi:hypothetical protein